MLRICSLVILLLPCASYAATIRYSYVDLGGVHNNFRVWGMNNRGWVVGTNEFDYPVRYRPGIGWEQISGVKGALYDVNSAGTAVGELHRAVGWHAIVRPKGEPWTDIGTLGGPYSWASAISDSGQVVGLADGAGGRYAFSYTESGGMVNLGNIVGGKTSQAFDVNESGQVLGMRETESGDVEVFLYDPVSGTTVANGLTYWATLNLSDTGLAVGTVVDRSIVAPWGYDNSRAATFSPTEGLRKLGTLGGSYSYAAGTNDRGWVVGKSQEEGYIFGGDHAFLYISGRGMMDLNDLVDKPGVEFDAAIDINDHDQILARGYPLTGHDGRGHYYLLSRIHEEPALRTIENPEPSTWLSAGTGMLLALSCWRARKRC